MTCCKGKQCGRHKRFTEEGSGVIIQGCGELRFYRGVIWIKRKQGGYKIKVKETERQNKINEDYGV